ncbi:unnamed protein product [Urochloa decumbens]|uniref:F-box protein n=1 Tax=Urochloa decumbens TaxID=240449 RepID=A0ABC8VVY8_9POAL
MGCQKLSRQSLHLVLGSGRGPYGLASMDISRPYTSWQEAKAAEAKPKENGSLLWGTKRSEPEPSIYYSTLRSPGSVSSSDRFRDAFALFGKSKIVCSDAGGFVTMYNTESHSFTSLPEMNSPKGPRYVALSIPRTAAHAMADFEIHPDVDSAMFGDKLLGGNHTESLYMMDMVPDKACSFEALVYYPVSRWCWRPLPPPPFHSDPKYRTPHNIPFALVDGTMICVSSDKATYCFDTVAMEWNKAGDWVLPFLSKLEYDTELKMWFGMSAHKPYRLCAVDLSGVAMGSCEKLPAVRDVGLEVDLPKNWELIDATLVKLGSGRFCIARFFDVTDEYGDYEYDVVAFTGVDCGGGALT